MLQAKTEPKSDEMERKAQLREGWISPAPGMAPEAQLARWKSCNPGDKTLTFRLLQRETLSKIQITFEKQIFNLKKYLPLPPRLYQGLCPHRFALMIKNQHLHSPLPASPTDKSFQSACYSLLLPFFRSEVKHLNTSAGV